ncbi:hypothetical protein SGCOL_003846 [Colletotrichum sp. CLE4]
MERTCQVQLLAEDAAYGDSVPRKVLISDDEANFNFDIESDPDICHCEVQVHYDFEEELYGGGFTA